MGLAKLNRSPYDASMKDIIAGLGGPTVIARILGIKPPSVIGWRGRVPQDRRPALERALYPRVSVEDFGDDARWQRVPDQDWPHPGGRPCLDVVAPPLQTDDAEPEQQVAL